MNKNEQNRLVAWRFVNCHKAVTRTGIRCALIETGVKAVHDLSHSTGELL